MKLFVVWAAAGLIFSLAGSTPANTIQTDPAPGEKIERSIAVSPQLTVTLCVASGKLTVRGWDKNELRVRSTDARHIELRRLDKTKDVTIPASRIDVMVLDSASRIGARALVDCQALADVEMEVPTGATVQVQTRDGDISITGVSGAYAGSQNGSIEIARATNVVEAGSIGGSITLRDSSGRIILSSAGGIVEVMNVKASGTDDTFEVGTVSGDIQLQHVSVPKVMAKTVNGTVTMTGPLTRSGHYTFTNMTGDVILALPHDASFQLNAKVSEKRDIVSDFQLKYFNEMPGPPAPAAKPAPAAAGGKTPTPRTPSAATPAPPKAAVAKANPPKTGPIISPVLVDRPQVNPHVLRRVTAVCGSGDATISVASFGGTVRLKKL
jgi:hypothetical protein